MDKIGLVETIDALRAEMCQAVLHGKDEEIQFPVGGVTIEFQVGITREESGDGKLKVWVLELGVGGTYTTESIHKLTITLDNPVDLSGTPIKVGRELRGRP